MFGVRYETGEMRFDIRFFYRQIERIDAFLLTPRLEHVDEKVQRQMVLDQMRIVQDEYSVKRYAAIGDPKGQHHRQLFSIGWLEIFHKQQYFLNFILQQRKFSLKI